MEQSTYDMHVKPVLQQYCYGCHSGSNPSAGIDLSKFKAVAELQRDQTTWRKVIKQVNDRSMPPQGVPHPSQDDRDRISKWLTDTLNSASASLLPKNPGHVLIHRLSRTEYNNTVRDLFGVNTKPADKFPADGGGGGGFDNNADTLFVPPILMERYLGAAGEVLNAAQPDRIFIAKPGKGVSKRAAAKQILSYFAMRGFRRPAEPGEVDRLMTLYDGAIGRKETHENAVKFALKGILISPIFLFRVENPGKGAAVPLNDYELASRLSYFLWSSMPDETLFKLAAQKKLRNPKVLEQQIARMIQSPKFYSFSDSFAGQWLRIRDLYTLRKPDPGKYPTFNPALQNAMYRETVEFFNSVVKSDASLLTLIDCNYTYLNEELAKHYGIDGVKGPEMRRVELTQGKRGGLLTMASVLTVTSYPQRTSPVLRGKWVLEEIFGTPPPPPPPGAGGLSADDSPKEGLTFRQRLENHRKKPECASCHSRMDPIGFGLENYDAIGRWRDKIGDQPVDSSGVFTDGTKFSGPDQLKQVMLKRKEEFIHNLTEKMLAYALGRGLESYDIPTVQKITSDVAKSGYKSDVLLRDVVMSYPFQYRKDS
jgi:hypothetical protein